MTLEHHVYYCWLRSHGLAPMCCLAEDGLRALLLDNFVNRDAGVLGRLEACGRAVALGVTGRREDGVADSGAEASRPRAIPGWGKSRDLHDGCRDSGCWRMKIMRGMS